MMQNFGNGDVPPPEVMTQTAADLFLMAAWANAFRQGKILENPVDRVREIFVEVTKVAQSKFGRDDDARKVAAHLIELVIVQAADIIFAGLAAPPAEPMERMFTMSQSEAAAAFKFTNKPHTGGGPIGGRFTYEFTPTAAGTAVHVRDNLTKEKIDVSDYENW